MMKTSFSITETDKGFTKLIKGLKNLSPVTLKAGLFGDGSSDPKTNVALRGYINEHGSEARGIPSRPFLQQTNQVKGESWNDEFIKMYNNNLEVKESGLVNILNKMVFDIKNQIVNGSYKENAPSTIAKKGSDKPLIDTGEMLNSITGKIEYGKGKDE